MTTRRAAALLVLAFGAQLLSGCAVMRMPDQLEVTNARIRSIESRLVELASALEAMRAMQQEDREVLREMRADQGTRLAEIERRVAALEELLRYSREQIDSTSRRLDDLGQLPLAVPSGGAASDTLRADPLLREQLYDSAYSALLQGRYPLAIKGFRDYLRQYPDGQLADDSQYWIGEAYYAQGEYETAASAFRTLVEVYPSSNKIPAALLKSGFAYAALGDQRQARALLEQVLAEHPYSDEAIKARDRLARLDERG